MTLYLKAHIPLVRLLSLSTQLSTYTTMCLSIDRAIAVARPFAWRTICSRGRVKGVLVASFLVSFALQVPDVVVYHDVTNIQYNPRSAWWDVYDAYITPFFFSALPTSGVIVANVVILTRLAWGMDEVRNTSSSDKRKSQVDKITWQVCLISLVTFLQHGLYISQMAMFLVRTMTNLQLRFYF